MVLLPFFLAERCRSLLKKTLSSRPEEIRAGAFFQLLGEVTGAERCIEEGDSGVVRAATSSRSSNPESLVWTSRRARAEGGAVKARIRRKGKPIPDRVGNDVRGKKDALKGALLGLGVLIGFVSSG